MTGGGWSVRTGWGSRIAASLALAAAIAVAGAISPAQAAPWTVYISESSGLAGWVGADTIDVIDSGDIGVGNTPGFLAANPSGTRVYVPNRSTGSQPTAASRAGVGTRVVTIGVGNVSVIDTETRTVVATIDDLSFNEPVAVAVKPDGSEAWVVNNFSGTVSIIDTATNLVTGTIDDGCFNSATGIAFNPVLPEAYVVADPDGKALCIVDTSSLAVTGGPFLDFNAVFPVVTPDGAKVYVTGDVVTIMDTATGDSRTITPFSLESISYLAVSNDGTKVYATSGTDNFLEIIDSSSADFNDDDFTDSFVDFGSAFSINTIAVVPGTDFGVVTDLNEGRLLWAFDTSTDAEILSDALPVSLTSVPVAIVVIGGGSAPPPPVQPPSPLDLQNDGMGAGWFDSCGMVVGRDGKGPMSAGESAGMIALYFALLLLPVGILKLLHGKKRLPLEKTGIVALFIVASMLLASSADATRIIAPKAQRFHPITDGQGALTVYSDETLCPGQFNFGVTLSAAKKPLDLGDIRELQVQKVIVDELFTADLTVAYGFTPDITLGLDVPYNYLGKGINVATNTEDSDSNLGDIRVNAKFRVVQGNGYGLALIPFANFATGNDDFLLSEGKFGFGLKVAGHLDVAKPLSLYANLGAEHIGDVAAHSTSPNYHHPWIQYGVGAKFLLPWRKDSLVAEVNGETSMATPYRHSTLSPLEFLAAYRAEVAPGFTLQAGGGGGLNKGMGAPQWRAILGIAYRM